MCWATRARRSISSSLLLPRQRFLNVISIRCLRPPQRLFRVRKLPHKAKTDGNCCRTGQFGQAADRSVRPRSMLQPRQSSGRTAPSPHHSGGLPASLDPPKGCLRPPRMLFRVRKLPRKAQTDGNCCARVRSVRPRSMLQPPPVFGSHCSEPAPLQRAAGASGPTQGLPMAAPDAFQGAQAAAQG